MRMRRTCQVALLVCLLTGACTDILAAVYWIVADTVAACVRTALRALGIGHSYSASASRTTHE